MEPALGLLPRSATVRVLEALDDTPVTVLQGARQTGKSTLASGIAASRGGVVVTMDDADVRNAASADPSTFVSSFGDRLLVIDEVQRAPELILAIKASVDRDRRPGRFLLTGSADLLRVPTAGDSLAGRAETVTLSPLSQGEFAEIKVDVVTAVLNGIPVGWESDVSRADLIERVLRGGYPEAARRTTPRRRGQWLDDYASRLLSRDASDLTRISSQQLTRTLELLAANQAGELVIAQLARDIGVSEMTAARYVDTLEALYLVERIPHWSRSLSNRRTKKPKCVVIDSGLCARVNRLTAEDFANPLGANHFGAALEGFVAAELLRQRTWSHTDYTLHHYRESGGAEVDLVISLPGGRAIGIEVKATTSPGANHFKGLHRLAERLGRDFVAGIVLHTGPKVLSFGKSLWALPVPLVWATNPGSPVTDG